MSRTHYYHHHPHCHCHCYNDMMYNNRIFRVVIKTFFICFPLMDFYVEFFWFSSEWRQKWRMINDEVNTSLRIETPERNERKNKNLNMRYWRGFYPFNTIIIYIYIICAWFERKEYTNCTMSINMIMIIIIFLFLLLVNWLENGAWDSCTHRQGTTQSRIAQAASEKQYSCDGGVFRYVHWNCPRYNAQKKWNGRFWRCQFLESWNLVNKFYWNERTSSIITTIICTCVWCFLPHPAIPILS